MFINGRCRAALSEYFNVPVTTYRGDVKIVTTMLYHNEEANLFTGQKNKVLQVKALHKIIKAACRELGFVGNFGTHTMRKTFAYHVYVQTGDIYLVNSILQHAVLKMTCMYCEAPSPPQGLAPPVITQDMIDVAYSNLNL